MDTPSTRFKKKKKKPAKKVRDFNNTSIKRQKMDARCSGNYPQSEEKRSSPGGQSQPVLTMRSCLQLKLIQKQRD